MYEHRFIKFSRPQGLKTTIRLRKQVDIAALGDTSPRVYFIPYNVLEFYGYLVEDDYTTGKNQKMTLLVNDYMLGVKYRKIKLQISHLITFQDELVLSGDTATETTTFNATPYLFIGHDTNGAYQDTALHNTDIENKHILGRKVLPYLTEAKDRESQILDICASVKSLQPNETWTHEMAIPDFGPWTFLNPETLQNVIAAGTDLHLLPGRYLPSTTTDQMISNNQDNWRHHIKMDWPGIYLQLPICKKADGNYFKFRGNFILEAELDFEVFIPPDYFTGSSGRNTNLAAFTLSLQKWKRDDTNKYTNVPFIVRPIH